MRKALIVEGQVWEVLDSGEKEFPPFADSLVWVECGPEVEQRWTYDGAHFAAPVELPPAA
jgi:hypothetical protein